ncbi:MAG: pilus assembly protein CpaF [Thermoleophilia bacterium]|jgi:pilus assembly protein CpaF|nr:pilus assembly protein CpaF [Thermoleophilia bacterium]
MSDVVDWIGRIRDRVWAECDPAAIMAVGDTEAPRIVAALAHGFLDGERHGLSRERVGAVVDGVVAATLGLGPLQPLLADDSVSEVMVNGHAEVFVERAGRIERVDVAFDDDAHLLHVIDRILAPVGRRIDALVPMVDARLPDGSRVNAVIPPLAVDGPILTIRRFVRVVGSLDDLVRLGSITSIGALELERLVSRRATVLVSGGTSTGKTTLLAAALGAASPDDRIVVLEDAAELPLVHPHRVRLESRPAGQEGAAAISMRMLVHNALRMRPDRLILGEVRGAEAYDLLQALNTGHRGSWSTIHANGTEEALLRLESMVLCADMGMPHDIVREQVARAVDAVVQLERRDDGRRAIAEVAMVQRVRDAGHTGWSLETVYEGAS